MRGLVSRRMHRSVGNRCLSLGSRSACSNRGASSEISQPKSQVTDSLQRVDQTTWVDWGWHRIMPILIPIRALKRGPRPKTGLRLHPEKKSTHPHHSLLLADIISLAIPGVAVLNRE